MSEEEYSPRHVKLSKANIKKMKEIKKTSGRTQQWIVNAALEYFFEHEWDLLIQ